MFQVVREFYVSLDGSYRISCTCAALSRNIQSMYETVVTTETVYSQRIRQTMSIAPCRQSPVLVMIGK